MEGFVHLRVHTEYSLVDGLVRVDELVRRTAELDMPAVAISDQGNLFALVRFFAACNAAGVKALCGCDLLLAADDEDADPTRFTLFVQDERGYRNLTELVSRSYVEARRNGPVPVYRAWLAEHAEGLIALSGGYEGELARLVRQGREAEADAALARWQGIYGDRFYLEVTRTGRDGEDDWVHAAVALAARRGVPVVATNDVRFLAPDDFEAHETRVCIHEGRTLDDPRRPRRYSNEQYLKTPAQMAERFEDLPEALENSVEIARRCNLSLRLGTYYLPEFPVPDGMSETAYFELRSREGLEHRLARVLDRQAPDFAERRRAYDERLELELRVIGEMGFAGYFLIVQEFINWAKGNGVPVGPGRGSGAGSLVAYALGITDLDPLAYDLLFERFLNPERVSMPDFDVDFCMEGRDRVIGHVAELYGPSAVSQIVTFGTMAAKAVVRDVARVQGKPYGLADKLSKLIPFEVGMTLERAMRQEEALNQFVEENEDVGEIMEMAFRLEGLVRNVGKHAGGVVIAPGRLTDFVPLVADDSGALLTQFDKDDVEQAGLVKFDFLGLRTLTIIRWAVEAINEQRARGGETPLEIDALALDDPDVFALLQRAETTAIFQLESRGMKDLISRLRPDSFEEIIALVALFRPGPLQSGMVDDFIDRKHGRAPVEYPHRDLESVLATTYGVILYQEQVMQIAQVLAGFSLGEADLLRRAMGKKKAEEMAQQRAIFMKGAAANGIDEATATHIFDLMEKFAGYGFNKSHSAAYALVSYQTAWLKTHYPAPFMAAVMSSDMQHTDKIVTFIEECRQMGLAILPPDVNRGRYRFTVTDQGEVIYGLGAIKGVGEGPIDAIVAAREADGTFADLFDLCRRVDPKKLGKRVLEALIRAGALDSMAPRTADGAPHRAALVAAIDDAVKSAEQHARNAATGMIDLFGGGHEQLAQACALPEVRGWSFQQRLQGEKETLGLYLTGHPIDPYEAEVRTFAPTPISDLRAGRGSERCVAGLIVGVTFIRSRRGDPIAFVTLDDRSDRIEVAVFSDLLEDHREKLVRDELLVVEGELGQDEYSGALKMRAQRLYAITEARARFASRLEVGVDATRLSPDFPERFQRLLRAYAGPQGCRVAVRYRRDDAQACLVLGEEWQVEPTDDLLQRLREDGAVDAVNLRYRDAAQADAD